MARCGMVQIDVTGIMSAPAAKPTLSERQRECLDWAARGLTSAQIGRRLDLSPRTVDEHILLACRALGVRTRVQAVARLALEARDPARPRGPILT